MLFSGYSALNVSKFSIMKHSMHHSVVFILLIDFLHQNQFIPNAPNKTSKAFLHPLLKSPAKSTAAAKNADTEG